jgi:hypothetical protein
MQARASSTFPTLVQRHQLMFNNNQFAHICKSKPNKKHLQQLRVPLQSLGRLLARCMWLLFDNVVQEHRQRCMWLLFDNVVQEHRQRGVHAAARLCGGDAQRAAQPGASSSL